MKLRIYTAWVAVMVGMLACQPKTQVKQTTVEHKKQEVQLQEVKGKTTYDVPAVVREWKPAKIKNVIFLIGDGMGTTQIYAGLTANKGKLHLERCPYIGFSKTYSSDDYITDSAAGATAFSIGKKTYNGAIGVDADKKPQTTILEIAEKYGLATGLVATSSITHATPASFIAHQPDRDMHNEIAADFLKTQIDVFIGGGKKYFEQNPQGNLLEKLRQNGYQVFGSLAEATNVTRGLLAILTADNHNPSMAQGRGNMLSVSTKKAIEILDQNEKGFFLMVEGSQIDWGGHANELDYVVNEMMDFDQVIGQVLDFAAKDGETLVIITADHETGGLTLNAGNLQEGRVNGTFTTGEHTSVMVPVFAFGPGAENFAGIYQNTEIFNKMMKAFGFEQPKP